MGLFGEVKCGRCDRRYSAIRGKCPYCGASKRRGGKATDGEKSVWQLAAGILLLLLIVVAVIVLITMSLKDSDAPPDDPDDSITNPLDSDGVNQVSQSPDPDASGNPDASGDAGTSTGPDDGDVTDGGGTTDPVDQAVLSISLNHSDFTILSTTEAIQMTATVLPADTIYEVEWSVENPNIAAISVDGVVTAVADGSTNIIARCGDKTATCIVRVKVGITAGSGGSTGGDSGGTGNSSAMRISHTDVTLVLGSDESFTLSVLDATGTVTFDSANPGVANVDGAGKVTAVSAGTTDVTAKCGDSTFTCTVRVKNG